MRKEQRHGIEVLADGMESAEVQPGSYERFAAICALLAAAAGLLYSLAFVVLKDPLLYSLFLMLGGLFTAAVTVALYDPLRVYGAAFALLGLLFGVVAALGSTIHGGYDLSNAINPPSSDPIAAANLPNQIDPRGLLTFGVAGIAVFVFPG